MSAVLNTQLKRIHFDDISMRGKARLLEMSHSRQIFGVCAQPFVGAGFVSWLILLDQDARGLLLWILCYCFASVGMLLQRKQYFRDKAHLTDAAMVNKWLPVVHGVALAHGMGLAIVLILGVRNVRNDFLLLHGPNCDIGRQRHPSDSGTLGISTFFRC